MAKGKVDAVVDVIKFDEDYFDSQHGSYRNMHQQDKSGEEKYAEFKARLRNMLGAQQQRVMAPSGQGKRRKVAKVAADDE